MDHLRAIESGVGSVLGSGGEAGGQESSSNLMSGAKLEELTIFYWK